MLLFNHGLRSTWRQKLKVHINVLEICKNARQESFFFLKKKREQNTEQKGGKKDKRQSWLFFPKILVLLNVLHEAITCYNISKLTLTLLISMLSSYLSKLTLSIWSISVNLVGYWLNKWIQKNNLQNACLGINIG